jgi:hypothetical protein
VLFEETAKLPFPDAQLFREAINARALLVEIALGYERERSANSVRRTVRVTRLRGNLRAAPQAWAKSCGLGGYRCRKEFTVLDFGRLRRTYRPTINAGRCHAYKEAAVESTITALQGAMADRRIQWLHTSTIYNPEVAVS